MKLILYTTVFSIALFSIGITDQETDITKKLDQVYHAAKSKSDLYNLEELVHRFLKVFPESSDITWRLGRIYFKLGEKSNSDSEKIRYYSLCLEQTGKALKIDSKSANGYFFNGLCSGSLGQVEGIWSSLGKIKPFKKDMETAISLNPNVNQGGPHRALANLYLKLPYLLGGDLDQSIIHFQEAVRLGPNFGENYLGLAQAYIQNKDFFSARDTLKAILNIKQDSKKEQSINKWHGEARSLLKKYQNK